LCQLFKKSASSPEEMSWMVSGSAVEELQELEDLSSCHSILLHGGII